MFISLPTIGSIVFSPTTFMASNPMLVYELAGHSLGHVLFGMFKRNVRRRGFSRAQIRKITNRKRRRFVDNIIMHHQRLAKINRETVVSNARERAIARKEKIARKHSQNQERQKEERKQDAQKHQKWQGGTSLKERGKKMRGMIDAKRTRARSRWLTVIADQPN